MNFILAGSCVDFFTVETGVLYLKAPQELGVHQQKVCELECLAKDNPTCVGFDWDRNFRSCFLHTNPDVYDANKGGERRIAFNVDSYRRRDCTKGKSV